MKGHRVGTAAGRQKGVTMLEVLITIVILAFGLLGLAGLQGRMQVAEIEAYQRAQAVVLLQEMADRIRANPRNSMDYVPGALGTTTRGTGVASQDCSALPGTPTQSDIDLCEWNNALLGAAEVSGGANLGAMIGARGCITNTQDLMPREFVVAVVWQGLASTATPVSTTCGQNQYGDETMRRAIVARVTIPCLQNVAGTATCVTP
jgi:type IV pilus assembly protein PilV